jgi:hypothetical protein
MPPISTRFAAVSGQTTRFAGKAVKGKRWPKYYGIQPTGFSDEPFVKELYYNNAAAGLILNGATRVPAHVPHVPPPQQPPTRPPLIEGPSLNNLR